MDPRHMSRLMPHGSTEHREEIVPGTGSVGRVGCFLVETPKRSLNGNPVIVILGFMVICCRLPMRITLHGDQ